MLGLAVGAAFGAGIVLAWSAFWEPAEPPLDDEFERPGPSWFEWWQVAAAVVAAGVAWFLTGWPAVSVAAATVVLAAPSLSGTSGAEAEFADRTEAVAGWVESLRDTMRGSRGIEGALRVTADTAPLPIRQQLRRMNRRITMGVPLRESLCQMADEVANPVCDMVVAVMVNALGLSSAQLPQMLDQIAEQARERAHAHLQVHTSRAKSRTQLRLVAIILFLSMVMFFVFFGSYLSPLRTPVGQVIVAVALGVMGWCLLWIAKLSALPDHGRVLDPGRGLREARPELWTR